MLDLHRCVFVVSFILISAPQWASAQSGGSGSSHLDQTLQSLNLAPISRPAAPADDAAVTRVVLGQKLFFDKILSGNRDVACATCHHPITNTADALSLGIGTGSTTPGVIGENRVKGLDREFIPRNAPEIFNRGSSHWQSAFWDSRAAVIDGVIQSPAGAQLPEGLETPLQVQAMFPVTSRDEMRGSLEDVDTGNELAAIDDSDFTGIWNALMIRLLEFEEYQQLFAEAFPDVAPEDIGFQHAATALAAFEAEAFTFTDSPYDAYLAGDVKALSTKQKKGAILFHGKANCATCHSGTLLTDQQHHNLAVPQFGPGKDPSTHLDLGRSLITNDGADAFAFRTPPLRNVAQTGPWMHNGAYNDLESAVRHHLNPIQSLQDYQIELNVAQIELFPTLIVDSVINDWMASELDIVPVDLKKSEVDQIVAFLESLSAPNLQQRLGEIVPDSVPSGLLEDGLPD